MSTRAETRIVTEEILGHATDFEIRTEVVGGEMRMTVSVVLPKMEWDGQYLRTYAPPRHPKRDEVRRSEREARGFELFGS